MSHNRNYLYNLASNVLPAVASIVSVPYLYNAIGNEEYGVLTLILGLLSYFALFDFGVGRVITQYVALNSKNERKKTGGILIGALITLIVSIIGFIITYELSDWIAAVIINPSEEIREKVNSSVGYCAYFIPLICMSSFLRGIIEGCEKFWLTSLVRIVATTLVYLIPVVMLMIKGGDLQNVIMYILTVRAIEFFTLIIAAYTVVREWNWKNLSFDFNFIIKNSAWMTFSNLISPLMVLSDRFYISWAMGAAYVSFYVIPIDLLLKFLVVPASITSAAYPRFAKDIKVSIDKFNQSYNDVAKLLLMLVVGVLVPLSMCIYWGLSIWINVDFAKNVWVTTIILIVGLGFNSLAQLPYNAIQSFGMVHLTTKLHLIELIIYIPSIIVLGSIIGLNGVAIAWTLRAIIDYSLLKILLKRIVYERSNNISYV